jgi:hypothetical protein
MPNLVKIRNIHLYIGWTDSAADCYAAKKALDEAGVPYNLLHYQDASQRDAALEPLNTWLWGQEPNRHQKNIQEFPVLHYECCYDDWTTSLELSQGLAEIQTFIASAKGLT